MRIQCPHCRTIHEVAPQLAGTRAQCRCGATIQIPAAPAAAAVATQPAARQPAAQPAAGGAFQVRCGQCQKVHGVTAAMRGTSARCGCGAVIQIPGGPAAAVPASSPFSAAAGAGGSILDELTTRDLQGPADASANGPVFSQQQRDAELLRKYIGDGNEYQGPSDRPGSIAALGTMKMIGIFFDGLGLFAIILLLTGLIDLSDRMVLIPQPVLIAAGLWMTIVIGINVLAVAGIFSGRPWGWFTASYSYCFWIFGSCGSVIVGLFSANVGQVCSNVFYVPFAIWAITRFTQDDAVKYFKLKMNPWGGIGIVFGVALLTWILFAVCLVAFGVIAALAMNADA